jgi:hypothetical protein
MGFATPSSSAAGRTNSVQEASGQEACTCANTKSNTPSAPSENETEDPKETEEEDMTGTTSHGSNTPSENSAQSSRAHAPSMVATPGTSSAAHHGVMTTPSAASPSRVATPKDADAFSPFRGAGSQVIPSLTVVAGGILAGVVGVFAAL